MRITHVIRGEDHVTNTAVRCSSSERLRLMRQRRFPHTIFSSARAARLCQSERIAFHRLAARSGYRPLAVAALATLTGSSDNVHAVRSLDELARFQSRMSRAIRRVSTADLETLTHRTLALYE
jgi:glutamyl-tRNA synthetase